ncbi:MAG: hypothetical protein ACK5ML_11780 [Lachnospiraceae bacterium]
MITITRKQPIMDELKNAGFTRIQDIALKDGTTLPCYQMGGFINTFEGHNLHVQCHNNQNMKPYEEAKKEYEAKKGNR